MDRAAALAQLAANFAQADAQLYAAEALDWVTSHPAGLWYAPTVADGSVHVVACNGRAIGQLWPGEGGHLLGAWTAAPFDHHQGDRLGPFRTARAAAAALAAACGVTPSSTDRSDHADR